MCPLKYLAQAVSKFTENLLEMTKQPMNIQSGDFKMKLPTTQRMKNFLNEQESICKQKGNYRGAFKLNKNTKALEKSQGNFSLLSELT